MFKWSVLNTIFRKHTRKTSKDTYWKLFFQLFRQNECRKWVVRLFSMMGGKNIRNLRINNLTNFCRNEENGIQDSTMARKMFRLLHMPQSNWHKILHPQRTWHLLCQVLWRQVCHQVYQMQQGRLSCTYPNFNF